MEMSKVLSIINKWNGDPDYAIEMLQDVQAEFHYIPKEVIPEISKRTGIPKTQLYFIATFYNAFSLTQRGEHEIQVCTGTTCHVKGAGAIIDELGRKLSVSPGETTEDLKYSLENVRCLGCCSLAPVVKVDDNIYGGVKSSRLNKILPKTAKTQEMGEVKKEQKKQEPHIAKGGDE
jgi:NADH-quinone oxidoreductase subunit E